MNHPLLHRLVPCESVRWHLRRALASLRKAWSSAWKEIAADKRQFQGQRGLKLNVGCGLLLPGGWVNIDEFPADGAYYMNVVNGLRLDDGSCRHIHCEHFAEHLEPHHAASFFAECRRVLEPGGTIRIIVPDAGKYMRAYAVENRHFFSQLKRLGNAASDLETPASIINQMFRMGGDHRFAWDFETLALFLARAGFSAIATSSRNDVAEELRIDGSDPWRELESLYVNAKRQ